MKSFFFLDLWTSRMSEKSPLLKHHPQPSAKFSTSKPQKLTRLRYMTRPPFQNLLGLLICAGGHKLKLKLFYGSLSS